MKNMMAKTLMIFGAFYITSALASNDNNQSIIIERAKGESQEVNIGMAIDRVDHSNGQHFVSGARSGIVYDYIPVRLEAGERFVGVRSGESTDKAPPIRNRVSNAPRQFESTDIGRPREMPSTVVDEKPTMGRFGPLPPHHVLTTQNK